MSAPALDRALDRATDPATDRATGGTAPGPGTSAARRRARTAAWSLVAAVLLVLLTGTALGTGQVRMTVWEALSALAGSGDPGNVLVVQEFRAPRVVSALIAGAGLAVAGSMLQRLFRNPLASPDTIGVTGGASFGAVLMLATGASQELIPLAALGGGLLAALLLGGFAWRSRMAVTRLVLVGLAVQQGLAAAVNLMIVRFPAELASSAMQWTTGSLYGRNWDEVWIGGSAVALTSVAVVLGQRRVAVLDLGDDSAGGLGLDPRRDRVLLLLLTIALASLAAALTGPVAFVALAVPHLVRLLAGPPTLGTLGLTALTGSLLLLGSDLLVLHVIPVHGLPVGAVTATLGAPWLLVLMIRQGRLPRRTS
ncbi:FecCD family ABC transporter permease [Kitasatospora purpeofusca]|uniref:FecCD family ABC transporter permease n=1 Tax=Kitasatospora purpeofusca TaxID=67352 RepID=UPI00367D317D